MNKWRRREMRRRGVSRKVENLTPCCFGPGGSGWILQAERNNPSRIISRRAVIGCGAERNPSRIISSRAVTGCGQDERGRHRFIITIIIIIIIITAPPPHVMAQHGWKNTMKDFIVHFDWMDYIRGGGGGSGKGRRAPTK